MHQQSFIQHPNIIPVKMVISDEECPIFDESDESCTGIMIETKQSFPVNCCVEVEINVQNPAFHAKGFISSCEVLSDGKFKTGVVFGCPETAFAVRMIEQICHIEEYREQVRQTEGRLLTLENAASEWITHHAADFPELNTI